jgi:hypothetical protein
MSLFSFGKSKQSSQQQSTSSGFSQNVSNSGSFSQGLSASQGTSTQGLAFQELFEQLYGGSFGAAAKAATQVPTLQGQAAQLFDAGTGFLQQLQGGTAQEYLANRISAANPLADQQIAALGGDIGAFLRDEINPTLTSKAVSAMQLGGGRQGVAQGKASAAALQEFQKGALGIRLADQASRDQAAGQLGALQQQGAATGLSSLGSLLGIGKEAAMADLAPQLALAQILGGSTVLTQSQQTASSSDLAQAFANALGYSYDTSQSTGSSKGRGFNLGVF